MTQRDSSSKKMVGLNKDISTLTLKLEEKSNQLEKEKNNLIRTHKELIEAKGEISDLKATVQQKEIEIEELKSEMKQNTENYLEKIKELELKLGVSLYD